MTQELLMNMFLHYKINLEVSVVVIIKPEKVESVRLRVYAYT